MCYDGVRARQFTPKACQLNTIAGEELLGGAQVLVQPASCVLGTRIHLLVSILLATIHLYPTIWFLNMGFSTPAGTPIVIATIFPALAIFSVAGRFLARRVKKIVCKADDWMVLVALTLGMVTSKAATHGELGKKQALDLEGNPYPNPALETFQKSLYATQITSQVAITLSRAAVLLLYTRIFFAQTHFILISRLLQVMNGAWGVSFLFIYIFQCWPISQQWTKSHGMRKHCVESGTTLWCAIAVSSVIIDSAILVLPWPYVFRLRLPKREKWGVVGIFMLGGLVLAAAIGKTWTFFNVGDLIERDHQITYNESTLMYWSIPETCLAVVCACLPTLRGLFEDFSLRSVMEGMRSSLKSRGSQKSTGSSGNPGQESTDLRRVDSRELSFETTPWGKGSDAERGWGNSQQRN
ncbi:uncharacterized protein BDR25DRAFT_377414 [Lindgomyces ingoldianus]|uniref:Uncharacterized protein n=1 Tax=Lindgomyces ingoldianus TaxID=673940 RepID=A0ACB6QIA2_9PLEO|nr:uncharacterized protein BDR25DRAFT_377414 [Lindgomyces ingoldianus]KAF2466313.1 hypothetical protein BDR25DRAFT_377414 [Lindgomyces ingoldianus]